MKLWLVLCIIGLVALVYGAHYFYRLSQGKRLIAISETFNRDYFVGKAEDKQITYLVMGDSTAVGTGAQTKEQSYPFAFAQALAQKGQYVHIINLAVVGATTQQTLLAQVPKALTLKPNIITLSVGANDVTHGIPTVEFKQSMESIVKQLTQLNPITLYLANTPNMGQTPAIPFFLKSLMYKRSVEQNKIMAEVAQNPSVRLVDLFGKGELSGKNLHASDAFHPNGAGYAIWARVFIDQLK